MRGLCVLSVGRRVGWGFAIRVKETVVDRLGRQVGYSGSIIDAKDATGRHLVAAVDWISYQTPQQLAQFLPEVSRHQASQ